MFYIQSQNLLNTDINKGSNSFDSWVLMLSILNCSIKCQHGIRKVTDFEY